MKVLVAGVGSIGQRHIRNLRALYGPAIDIAAYRVRRLDHVITEDRTIESGANVERKYGLQVYDDLDRALEAKPDAVFVCNPTAHHMTVALAAARAGCHLFVEKPLSNTCAGVDELLDVVARKQLIAMVGYQLRFHPALLRVRSLLSSHAIGRVVSARAAVGEYLAAAHPYEDYRVSYAGRASLGGGVVLSQSHELDYLYWLFGAPRRVFALGGRLGGLDVDVEDTASILLECVVDGRTVPVHLSQDFVQRPPRRTLQVVGERGTVDLDLIRAAIDVTSEGATAAREEFAGITRNDVFVDELAHFVACVEGNEAPLVTLRSGADVLRIGLAALESMRTGRVVPFA